MVRCLLARTCCWVCEWRHSAVSCRCLRVSVTGVRRLDLANTTRLEWLWCSTPPCTTDQTSSLSSYNSDKTSTSARSALFLLLVCRSVPASLGVSVELEPVNCNILYRLYSVAVPAFTIGGRLSPSAEGARIEAPRPKRRRYWGGREWSPPPQSTMGVWGSVVSSASPGRKRF